MLFRNLIPFRLGLPFPVTSGQLADMLAKKTFNPCGATEQLSAGWIPPRDNGPLVHVVEQQMLLKLQVQERKIPGSVLNRRLEEKIKAFESRKGQKVGRKLKKDMKEQARTELLPKILPQDKFYWVWIDAKGGYLGVDTSSNSKACDVLGVLRTCLNFEPAITRFQTALSPSALMGDWLAAGSGSEDFSIDDQCELVEQVKRKGVVRYSRHNLCVNEVKQHLAAGKIVKKLGMTFADMVSVVLTDVLELKSVKFLEVKTEDYSSPGDGADDVFDAELLFMAGTLAKLLDALLSELGEGEGEEEGGDGQDSPEKEAA